MAAVLLRVFYFRFLFPPPLIRGGVPLCYNLMYLAVCEICPEAIIHCPRAVLS